MSKKPDDYDIHPGAWSGEVGAPRRDSFLDSSMNLPESDSPSGSSREPPEWVTHRTQDKRLPGKPGPSRDEKLPYILPLNYDDTFKEPPPILRGTRRGQIKKTDRKKPGEVSSQQEIGPRIPEGFRITDKDVYYEKPRDAWSRTYNPFLKEEREAQEKEDRLRLRGWREQKKLRKDTRPNPLLHPMSYMTWRKQATTPPKESTTLPGTIETSEEEEAPVLRATATQTTITFPHQDVPKESRTRSQSRYWWKFQTKDTPEEQTSKYGRLRERYKGLKNRWNTFLRRRGQQPAAEEVIELPTLGEETGTSTQTEIEAPQTQQRIPKKYKYLTEEKRQKLLHNLYEFEMKALDAKYKIIDVENMIKEMRTAHQISSDQRKAKHLDTCEARIPGLMDVIDSASLIIKSLQQKTMETREDKTDIKKALQYANKLIEHTAKETKDIIRYIQTNVAR